MNKISVCIATYNGEKYIKEQLDSILSQLSRDDEVIIVDDCSKDNTVDIIKTFNDERIKLYFNKSNLRHVKTFENAISSSSGDIIFLSDQDDIWCKGRVHLMVDKIKNSDALLLISSFDEIDKKGEILQNNEHLLFEKDSRKSIKNMINIFLGRADYWGCSMCFKKDLKKYILPIPINVVSHDIWFAIVGIYLNKIIHLESKTLLHRIHESNVTPKKKRSIMMKLLARWNFFKQFYIIFKRKLGIKINYNNKEEKNV